MYGTVKEAQELLRAQLKQAKIAEQAKKAQEQLEMREHFKQLEYKAAAPKPLLIGWHGDNSNPHAETQTRRQERDARDKLRKKAGVRKRTSSIARGDTKRPVPSAAATADPIILKYESYQYPIAGKCTFEYDYKGYRDGSTAE